MNRWTRMLRGAIGMGVTWAIVWVGVGLVIGASSVLIPVLPWNRFFEIFDAPLPALAIPGFIAGALFSGVLGVAGRRRRFDELSLPAFSAWGALGGLLLACAPQLLASLHLATISDRFTSPWQLTAIIAGPFMLLSAASACATLLVARRAAKGERAGADSGSTTRSGDSAVADAPEGAASGALPTGRGLDAIRQALGEASPPVVEPRPTQHERSSPSK